MKVNIDAGTAALLSEVLEGQQDPGLSRLKGYVDQQLDKARPSESLSADEVAALIGLTHIGVPADRAGVLARARQKLQKMLDRKTDPSPAARAVADLHRS